MLVLAVCILLMGTLSQCNGFQCTHAPKRPIRARDSSRKRWHSLSNPLPSSKINQVFDVQSSIKSRKQPNFPGAVPINSTDVQILIHQTNQENPSNAILGKPSSCLCQYGFPQAFSLDPIPFSQNRLNSGLLKLTCPLLVNNIDSLEDDGFMEGINRILQEETLNNGDSADSTLTEFINEAHTIHSESRKDLLSAYADVLESTAVSPYQIIENKLGKKGAQFFMNAGVAGANPMAEKPDVKCLHAWMADFLFRKVPDDDNSSKSPYMISADINSGMARYHPIGDMIKDELSKRGVTFNGTQNCHQICSGVCSSIKSQNGMTVSVPTPRNKQRKRSVKGTERRRRIKQERAQIIS